MVLKASKTQILDVNDIKKFCIICYSTFYISQIAFYIVSEMEKGLSPLRLCFSDNYSFQGRFPGGQLIVGSYNLGFCVLGIFNDIRLYQLIKKKTVEDKKCPEGIKNDGLVPWKSTNEEQDPGIPLRATLISTISTLIFVCILYSIYLSLAFSSISFSAWFILLASLIISGTRLPLMLIFTIKHKKTKMENQPPKTLQFHEESEGSVSMKINFIFFKNN